MQGSLKTLNINTFSWSKTNFDDWSDPKLQLFSNKTTIKRKELKNTKPHSTSSEEQVGSSELQEVEKQTSLYSDTSVKVELLRKRIREGYPLLTQKEIRVIKLPFYQSLIANLNEEGFIGASQFISDLIDMDEEWHEKRLPLTKNRPTLKSSIPALTKLCEGLKAAEIARAEHNEKQELTSMLMMAVHFGNEAQESWHWLAEELYEQCEGIIYEESEVLGKELISISKYSFASFLFNVLRDTDRSKSLVEDSMELAKGNFWNASKILNQKLDIHYFECCLLLHKIYLWMAQEMKNMSIEDAIQLCRQSLYWAMQIHFKTAEVAALLNLIMIYLQAQRYDLVPAYIQDYMKVCNEVGDAQALCEGCILKAHFHECLGDKSLMVEDVKELLKIAEENSLLKMMAVAHRKLATLYFIKGNQKDMLEHAVNAYNLYVTLDSRNETDEATCLTGIAHAQEIMSQYLSLVLDANEVEDPEFKMLMQWKTLRIPFFYNVKLFQPEAEINEELKDKVTASKIEEILIKNKTRKDHVLVSSSSLGGSKSFVSSARKFSSGFREAGSQRGKKIIQSVISFNLPIENAASISSSVGNQNQHLL